MRFEQPPIPSPEGEKKTGITPEECDLSIRDASERRERVYIETPLGKAIICMRNHDQVMVDLLDNYGEIAGSSLFDLKDISLMQKPEFPSKVYYRSNLQAEAEYQEGEEQNEEEDWYRLTGEEYIIPTSHGDLKGKIIYGYKGGPGIVETQHGKIRVDELL